MLIIVLAAQAPRRLRPLSSNVRPHANIPLNATTANPPTKMKESQFGFEYTWSDLKPVRWLAVIVVAAQVVGLAVGLAFPRFPNWFQSMWFGGALATFPAFLMGLFVQARQQPGSISANAVMVRRLGLIAALLSVFALAMPVLGFGR